MPPAARGCRASRSSTRRGARPGGRARSIGPSSPSGHSRRSAQQGGEDRQGEPLPRGTVGGIGEVPSAEVDHVRTGGVAVKDLEDKQIDGRDRIEHPLAPRVFLLLACLSMASRESPSARSCLRRPKMVTIRTGTGGLLRGQGGWDLPPDCPEPLLCSRCYNLFRRQDLCTNFVAFRGVSRHFSPAGRRGRPRGGFPELDGSVIAGRGDGWPSGPNATEVTGPS